MSTNNKESMHCSSFIITPESVASARHGGSETRPGSRADIDRRKAQPDNERDLVLYKERGARLHAAIVVNGSDFLRILDGDVRTLTKIRDEINKEHLRCRTVEVFLEGAVFESPHDIVDYATPQEWPPGIKLGEAPPKNDRTDF